MIRQRSVTDGSYPPHKKETQFSLTTIAVPYSIACIERWKTRCARALAFWKWKMIFHRNLQFRSVIIDKNQYKTQWRTQSILMHTWSIKWQGSPLWFSHIRVTKIETLSAYTNIDAQISRPLPKQASDMTLGSSEGVRYPEYDGTTFVTIQEIRGWNGEFLTHRGSSWQTVHVINNYFPFIAACPYWQGLTASLTTLVFSCPGSVFVYCTSLLDVYIKTLNNHKYEYGNKSRSFESWPLAKCSPRQLLIQEIVSSRYINYFKLHLVQLNLSTEITLFRRGQWVQRGLLNYV